MTDATFTVTIFEGKKTETKELIAKGVDIDPNKLSQSEIQVAIAEYVTELKKRG